MNDVQDAAVDQVNASLAMQADHYIDEKHATLAGLGDKLFETFKPDAKNDKISTQVRNLQQVTVSATRFADIEDFVKNQMGKDSKTKLWHNAGPGILSQLAALRTVEALTPGGRPGEKATPAEQHQFRLHLARGWVRAVVSHYLYRFALQQIEKA